VHDARDRRREEGSLARQQRVGHGSEREDVHPAVHLLRLRLLRNDVERRSDELAGRGELLPFGFQAGDAEIRDFHLAGG
jgi:hypothetical protein